MRARSLSRIILKTVAVAAVLAWSLVPILLIAMSSFKADRDIFAVPPRLGFHPTLSNYIALWERWGDFFFGLFNSLIVTTGATLLAVLTSAMAGYAYSRFRHPLLAGSAFFLI
ncbi:carbohydrate ABC transporter permease, partial [Corallococcus exiguus]|nr:carbohydrate ABC transporter permease [Corallococcus exiguus]